MTEPTNEERCLSSTEVIPGVLKRCTFYKKHKGEHYWLEAIRDDGKRLSVWWNDQKQITDSREINTNV